MMSHAWNASSSLSGVALISGASQVLSIFLAVLSHHGDPIDLRRANSADAQLWDEKAYDDLRELGVFMRENWSEAWSDDETGRLPSNARFQHMFAGLVALADWLGSDTEFFPLDRVQYESLFWSRQQAVIAVREIGLALGRVPPAAPKTFREAFGVTPRPLQCKAATMRLGHIMVLEDETGSGKTEAAMWIWRRLHDGGLVDGLYFALPTRSAATQIHRRIEKNLRLSLWGNNSAPACVLAVPGYIKADDQTGHRLHSTEERPLPSRFMVQWDDDPAAAERHRRWAAEWPLRYLAAYFAAGTIDQALLSGLKVNHSSMRASALARSLLLVDELHASDAYMGQVLLRTVSHHVACGGYVLALSATLGSSLRSRLFGQDQPSFAKSSTVPYPSVHVDGRTYKIRRGRRRKSITVTTAAPTDVIPLIMNALADDAAVLVIRNTVNDAVAVFHTLERMGVNAILHHSRYGVEDRKELDRRVELALAKDRPPGAMCVVGTQTLEQSLDIDADVLITDLCPMDVLLQRIGRLHRHDRVRPEAWREPHAFVVTPGDDLEPLVTGQHTQGLAWISQTRAVHRG